MPYRIKTKFKGRGTKLNSPRYSGLLDEAPQEELEFQYRLGNPRIEQYEEAKKKAKAKQSEPKATDDQQEEG